MLSTEEHHVQREDFRRYEESGVITDYDVKEAKAQQQKLKNYYQGKTVFLTGATGGLGGNIMYQLINLMDVRKIFVLTRNSEKETLNKWRKSMSAQVPMYEHWIEHEKLVLVQGDSTQVTLGISAKILRTMEDTVHIIVNAAANTDFNAHPKTLIRANCCPVLELADMAEGKTPGTRKWTQLESFVHVSSAYVNCFMEDQPIEEKIYAPNGSLEDAEARLKQILQLNEEIPKRSPTEMYRKLYDTNLYLWPYAESKHLAEQLLLGRYPYQADRQWNLMIARVACIGPALMYPHPNYGPDGGSNPSTKVIERLMTPKLRAKAGDEAAYFLGVNRGLKIIDELPADVSTAHLLALVPERQTGVVHLTSGLYVKRSAKDLYEMHIRYMPDSWLKRMRIPVFVDENSGHRGCEIDLLYRMVDKDLDFVSRVSQETHPGIIALEIKLHKEDSSAICAYDLTRIEGLIAKNGAKWCSERGEQHFYDDAVKHHSQMRLNHALAQYDGAAVFARSKL